MLFGFIRLTLGSGDPQADCKAGGDVLDQQEERPHAGTGTASGWTFKTLEHDEHAFPHAMEATDERGRLAIYLPLTRRSFGIFLRTCRCG